MLKDFIKSNIASIALTMLPLVIFALFFALFDLNGSIYRAAAGLTLLFLLLYLCYQGLHFKQERHLKTEIQELQELLQEEKTQAAHKEQEMEEYFLLWVHQIKSPISASELLLQDSPNTDKKVELQQQMLKIENYTNMVLNFLKVTDPATDMEFSYVSIDQLVQPLVRKYRLQFIQYKIRLHYESTKTKVLTEPDLTALMLEQLLNNALKYAQGKEIWIHYRKDSRQLIIRDSGSGIRSEDLPRIFDKGYAGLNGQLNTQSSGIGLFLVKKISERLQQPVSVTSTFGQGTCFKVQLLEDESYKTVS